MLPILDTVQDIAPLEYLIAREKVRYIVAQAVEHDEVRRLIGAQLAQVNDTAFALSERHEDDELEILGATLAFLGVTILAKRLGWATDPLLDELESYLLACEEGTSLKWIDARDVGAREEAAKEQVAA